MVAINNRPSPIVFEEVFHTRDVARRKRSCHLPLGLQVEQQEFEMEIRMIKVGAANLECALSGSGNAVVLLPNAGCGMGYLGRLTDQLTSSGFTTVAVNMRGVANSTGPLEGASLHDLAADVAGVIDALGCAPAHVLGHAFGNRVARWERL